MLIELLWSNALERNADVTMSLAKACIQATWMSTMLQALEEKTKSRKKCEWRKKIYVLAKSQDRRVEVLKKKARKTEQRCRQKEVIDILRKAVRGVLETIRDPMLWLIVKVEQTKGK